MFFKLYKKLYSDYNLNQAWRAVRRQGQSAGIDGLSPANFGSKAFIYLKEIQNDLRTYKYRQAQVKQIFLRRDIGPPRPIGLLNVRDRIVHRALAQILIPVFEPHFDDYSHAYRTGHSPKTAIAQAKQHALADRPWLLKLDLSDCFESVPHRPLLRCVKRRVRDFAVRKLLKRILTVEVITESRSGTRHVAKVKGLLQGSPLSPLLANIYLDLFDKAARRFSLFFVRYGDDIVLFAGTREQAQEMLRLAKRILTDLHLQINPEKTKLCHLGQGCNYLGEWLALKKVSNGEWKISPGR